MIYFVVQPVSALVSGVFLHRETETGEDLHLIHGGNIQINHATVIGNRVGIMHGVTLGASTDPQAPTICDDAFIGCNSSVLGGVTVGERATISANSLVISDVPPDSLAIGVPAKIVKKGLLGKTTFKTKEAND